MNMMQDDDYAYECNYVFASKIKNMIAKNFFDYVFSNIT